MELSQLLSIAESQAIDQAPISIQAKFLTRITIHAWRVWLQVGQSLNQPVEQLSPRQMMDWLASDAQLSRQGQPSFLAWAQDDRPWQTESESDLSSDQQFVVRLLVSAWDNLGNIAAAHHCAIADLTTEQILSWVASKQQPGQSEIFLGDGDRKTG
ncbi:MAG: hypothetical protein SFT94_11615 [Pseudanabaenaceae cyanobacterium bins.68]|nr:hypothetical protein [Pseudanabaenaceae cyanobacterium bins.68]